MWSRSRSALDPSSVTTAPLTVTRPATIICSAWRRDATPACERIFWIRSSGISSPRWRVGGLLRRLFRLRHAGQFRLLRFRECHAPDLFEFLERWQLAQVLQPELDQKLPGGLVKDRPADDVLAPRRRDQLTVQQRLQNAGALHAPDGHDFGRRDGLLVGDHGQGLQRRQRELERRLEALDEAADGLVVLRLSGHFEAAGHFPDAHAVLRPVEFLDKLAQQRLNALQGLIEARWPSAPR